MGGKGGTGDLLKSQILKFFVILEKSNNGLNGKGGLWKIISGYFQILTQKKIIITKFIYKLWFKFKTDHTPKQICPFLFAENLNWHFLSRIFSLKYLRYTINCSNDMGVIKFI